jgi:hypothetical protein
LDQKIRLIQETNRQAFGHAFCPRLGGNGANSRQQQERFDAFVCEFDAELPQEALDMKMRRRTLCGLTTPALAYPSWPIRSTIANCSHRSRTALPAPHVCPISRRHTFANCPWFG